MYSFNRQFLGRRRVQIPPRPQGWLSFCCNLVLAPFAVVFRWYLNPIYGLFLPSSLKPVMVAKLLFLVAFLNLLVLAGESKEKEWTNHQWTQPADQGGWSPWTLGRFTVPSYNEGTPCSTSSIPRYSQYPVTLSLRYGPCIQH